jgi:hypothetical protein
VWITHAKVGHRQTPIKQKAQPCVGLFALWNLIGDLLEFMTRRAADALRYAQDRLRQADGTTVEPTSHPTKQPEDGCQAVGYSHSTKPASGQVAGYQVRRQTSYKQSQNPQVKTLGFLL